MKYSVRFLLFFSKKLNCFQLKNELYFAYGANLGIERYVENDIPFIDKGSAFKEGYEINFTLPCRYLDMGFANIQEKKGHYAWGRLYQVSKLGITFLDIIERVPFGYYSREEMVFKNEKGECVKAWCYVACHPQKNLTPPSFYLNYMREKSAIFNFPKDYRDYLESTKSREYFDIDYGFCFSNPKKRRPFVKQLLLFYKAHDFLREFIIKYLP